MSYRPGLQRNEIERVEDEGIECRTSPARSPQVEVDCITIMCYPLSWIDPVTPRNLAAVEA